MQLLRFPVPLGDGLYCLALEMALFDEAAVSGVRGIVYHGLHWRGLTGSFNDAGFSKLPLLAFCVYRLV